jgi:hypothetical protein
MLTSKVCSSRHGPHLAGSWGCRPAAAAAQSHCHAGLSGGCCQGPLLLLLLLLLLALLLALGCAQACVPLQH